VIDLFIVMSNVRVCNRALTDKDATVSARVVMAGLVIRLLVNVSVRLVSAATSVKTAARQVYNRRNTH